MQAGALRQSLSIEGLHDLLKQELPFCRDRPPRIASLHESDAPLQRCGSRPLGTAMRCHPRRSPRETRRASLPARIQLTRHLPASRGFEVSHCIRVRPRQKALDRIVQPVRIQIFSSWSRWAGVRSIGDNRSCPPHRVSRSEYRVQVTRTRRASKHNAIAAPPTRKISARRPTASSSEASSPNTTDVVRRKGALGHTRLRALAVMKIPLVRKEGGDS